MKRIFGLAALVLILFSFTILFVNPFPNLVQNKLEDYRTKDYPEKVYVHTDKSFYSLEETIWYNAYLVNGINHLHTDKSLVMYVELINGKDSIVDQKIHLIRDVSSAGDFKISKNWKEGNYLLRAYTTNMRNKSSDYFFQKEISILTSDVADNTSKEIKEETAEILLLPRPDLNFYPEGGDLVMGVLNKVAVKIKDKYYSDKTVSIAIYNSKGNKVSVFKTMKFGLGLFSITPKENETYYASIVINDSEEQYALPKALSKGIALSVVNNGSELVVGVSSNLEKGLKGTYLVGHQRGKLVFQKFKESTKDNYFLNLPIDNLDDGVLHLTLFNAEGNPTCERLVFIDNAKKNLAVIIEKENSVLNSRQQQTLTIDVKDLEGTSVSSDLSMTVRDLGAVPQNNYAENIKTWLLLNSDLRGEIQDIGYFFEKENNLKRRYLLDLTMLTQGWRRFTWNELLFEEKRASTFPIEKGIKISGITKSLKKPYGKITAATRISFMTKSPYQETQQSDSLGAFKYGPFVFFDSIPALIEARMTNFNSVKSKDRKVLILVDKPLETPKVNRNKLFESKFSNEQLKAAQFKIAEYIKEMNFKYNDGTNQLNEVFIKGKIKDENFLREQEMDERTGYGAPSARIVVDDLDGSQSLSVADLLRRISGVQISGTSVSIRGGGPPLFYLDGMQIDSTYVASISGSDISFIDVLKGPDAAIFSNSGNGVVALYSKIGSNIYSSNVKRKPGIIDFAARGFYTAKEFYAPNYLEVKDELPFTDVRTTLHWEPKIRIIKDEKAKVSFFTCDSKGEYIIEVEGISTTGIPIYSQTTFVVE